MTQDWILSSVKKIHAAPNPPAFLVTQAVQSPGSTPSERTVCLCEWGSLIQVVFSRTGVVFDVQVVVLGVVLIISVVDRVKRIQWNGHYSRTRIYFCFVGLPRNQKRVPSSITRVNTQSPILSDRCHTDSHPGGVGTVVPIAQMKRKKLRHESAGIFPRVSWFRNDRVTMSTRRWLLTSTQRMDRNLYFERLWRFRI